LSFVPVIGSDSVLLLITFLPYAVDLRPYPSGVAFVHGVAEESGLAVLPDDP
jgi:hypothetical protein